MDEIKGVIQDIVFRNEQNGYSVVEIECEKEVVTVVGYFAFLNLGEMIKADGTWIQHKDYGMQFKMESYSVVTPASLIGIEKYLGSGFIPGVGPSIAKKLVEKFGMDTLDIIQYNPDKLLEIEGIGKKKADKMNEAFQEQKELRDIMVFLEQYGVSPTYAVKIYKAYGINTIREIKENPYRLADDVFGIGFKMADKIAMSMGISTSSEYRLASGAKYMINYYHGQGHTYVPRDLLIEKTQEILDVDKEDIDNTLMALFLDGKISVEKLEDCQAVYSTTFYKAESGVCRRLMQLARDVPAKIDAQVEGRDGITLAPNQKKAVEAALENGIVIITGGPGTGKTTTINTIIKILEEKGLSVLLAAPTGRAAKRMQEATGKEAKTIHRLLEYGAGDDEADMFFQRNEDSPLEVDVLIIDEVSMVDIILMNNLLKAIPEGTRVILVGDSDQLPSVGPGNVLRDMIESSMIPVVKLNEIFRQAEESLIVVNAHKINNGEHPILSDKNKDFFFVRAESGSNIVNTIIDLCSHRLPKFTGYDFYEGIQVLSPMRKGECGVQNLNSKLQERLNPPDEDKKEKIYRDIIFRVGDKVMQVKNNYKLKWQSIQDFEKEGEGIFNGDIGLIQNIDGEEQYMEVVFDNDKLIKYEYSNLDELEHAYALTVHKSQGSEFPVVIMPATYGAPMLLTRNLLYTALTRAKKLVVIVGHEKYIKQMVDNNYITTRYSGLKQRLSKLREMYE